MALAQPAQERLEVCHAGGVARLVRLRVHDHDHDAIAFHDGVRDLTEHRPAPLRIGEIVGWQSQRQLDETGDRAVWKHRAAAAVTATPSRIAARGEARKILDSALVMLPPDYGTVIHLYDLEGRTASEVAERMGRSEGAVYMVRTRAHERLRAILGSSSRFFSESP